MKMNDGFVRAEFHMVTGLTAVKLVCIKSNLYSITAEDGSVHTFKA